MSRIGKQPVEILSGVEARLGENNVLHVKGPKGELVVEIHPRIEVVIEDKLIIVKRKSDAKLDKSLHGLFRSLIQNAVIGVKDGFEKQLQIIGVGYRAQAAGKKITLSLGFSHPVEYIAPEGITIEMIGDKKDIISVKGINKQTVGEVAAKIRSYRKPEPYKGKGIRYVGEYVARKAGKAAAKGA